MRNENILICLFVAILVGCTNSKQNQNDSSDSYQEIIVGSWKRLSTETISYSNGTICKQTDISNSNIEEIVRFSEDSYEVFNFPFHFIHKSDYKVIFPYLIFVERKGDLVISKINSLDDDSLVIEIEVDNRQFTSEFCEFIDQQIVRITYKKLDIDPNKLSTLKTNTISSDFLIKKWKLDKVIEVYENGILGNDMLVVQDDEQILQSMNQKYSLIDLTDTSNYTLNKDCIRYKSDGLDSLNSFKVYSLSDSRLILLIENNCFCESDLKALVLRSSSSPTEE